MLSPPKKIPMQSLLYKKTTCLTQPVNFDFPKVGKMTISFELPSQNQENGQFENLPLKSEKHWNIESDSFFFFGGFLGHFVW